MLAHDDIYTSILPANSRLSTISTSNRGHIDYNDCFSGLPLVLYWNRLKRKEKAKFRSLKVPTSPKATVWMPRQKLTYRHAEILGS